MQLGAKNAVDLEKRTAILLAVIDAHRQAVKVFMVMCNWLCCIIMVLTGLLMTASTCLVMAANFRDYPSITSEHGEYANEAVGAIEHITKKYELHNQPTGIWKLGDSDEYGLTFMFGIALDYFRCSNIPTVSLHDGDDLDGINFVVAPWEVDELTQRGFVLLHDENWVYLYEAPPIAR